MIGLFVGIELIFMGLPGLRSRSICVQVAKGAGFIRTFEYRMRSR